MKVCVGVEVKEGVNVGDDVKVCVIDWKGVNVGVTVSVGVRVNVGVAVITSGVGLRVGDAGAGNVDVTVAG